MKFRRRIIGVKFDKIKNPGDYVGYLLTASDCCFIIRCRLLVQEQRIGVSP